MTSNDEKRQLFMRRPDELAFSRLLKKHSSPIPHMVAASNELTEFTAGDRVKRLDQQMAEMKRRNKHGSVNGSPKQRQANTCSPTNSVFKKNPGNETVVILDDDDDEDAMEHRTSANLSEGTHSYTRRGHQNNHHGSPGQDLSPDRDVRRKSYLSNTELLLPETEMGNSTLPLTSSSSLPDEKMHNAPLLRAQKGESVNMFDSIPSTNIIENNTSVEVPESNDSQENENYLAQKRLVAEGNSSNGYIKLQLPPLHSSHLFSSSPIKTEPSPRKKKRVAFSSDVESSPLTSSPTKGPSEPRSILKLNNVDLNYPAISIDDLMNRDLSQNESWPAGFVLQIPEGYNKTQKVVQSCVSGLSSRQFKKQYEVYATLNDLIKRSNKIIHNSQVFSKDVILKIISSVKNNLGGLIVELKNGSNAFQLRTSSQGIKLISMLGPVTVSFKEMSAVYDNVIKLLKNENISKSLASSIFQFVKILPEPFFDKIEALIMSLTQMKYFLSVTMTCEKLNILKRFVLLQPAVARKSNYQIFSHLLYSILNTDVPGYPRVLFSAISVFTTFAKNNESNYVITKILSERLEDSFSSIRSASENQLKPWWTIGEAVCETMKYLIHLRLFPQTAKIWAYLLYMSCQGRKAFILENWELFVHFKSVYQNLYSQPQAIALCLEAWKSVVYNFQIVPLKSCTDEQLREKMRTLLFPFENAQLTLDDGTTLNQWTQYEGFLVLYCRIYYSVRLHMESATEPQMCILLHSILKPLMRLKEWDSVYAYITKMIFTSDRYVYAETEDSCFWLSDYEKWKSRILPLPKTIFKNSDAFSVVLEMTRRLIKRPVKVVSHFVSNCVYLPLANLKLALPFRDYCKVAEMAASLVSELFDNSTQRIQKGLKSDASDLFQIIEKADEYFMFTSNATPLMTVLLNKFKICENRDFIVQFISQCHLKYSPAKLFATFLVSDIYENPSLLADDDKFPQALHYCVDVTQLEQLEFKLSDTEKRKIVSNLKRAFSMYLSHNGIDNFPVLTNFLEKSKLFDVLNPKLKLELFEGLLDSYALLTTDLGCFYKDTPSKFFQTSLEIFSQYEDNDEVSPRSAYLLRNLLLRLKNVDTLPDLWLLELGPRLGYILQPDITKDTAVLVIFSDIMHRLPSKMVSRLKKLAIKRQVDIRSLSRDSLKGEEEHTLLEAENNVCSEKTLGQSESVARKDAEEDCSINDTIELEKSVEKTVTNDIASTQIISSPIEECDVSFVQTDEEDYRKVFLDNTTEVKNNQDLKSFIIDSIQIDGSVDGHSVRVPSSPEEVNIEKSASPARRTRSHTSSVEYEGVEFIMATKRQKKDKKARKDKKKEKREKREKRRRSRSLSVELDEASMDGTIAEEERPLYVDQQGRQEHDGVDGLDVSTDMGQFWRLLKKLNNTPIEIEAPEKENLETDLVALLMKLKKG